MEKLFCSYCGRPKVDGCECEEIAREMEMERNQYLDNFGFESSGNNLYDCFEMEQESRMERLHSFQNEY